MAETTKIDVFADIVEEDLLKVLRQQIEELKAALLKAEADRHRLAVQLAKIHHIANSSVTYMEEEGGTNTFVPAGEKTGDSLRPEPTTARNPD